MTAAPSPPATGPRPRRQPRWVLASPAEASAVSALTDCLHLPEPICRLLVARGFADGETAKTFLRPRLDALHAPEQMLGIDRAVERLARATRGGETVLVHGDYDVDGICSTALLTRVLRRFGARVIPFIPRRIEDGYDLGPAGVSAAIDARASVVVTCDCGTSALAPVRQLCEAGIDVIVSDHHLPGGPLPECLAVLNPKRPGCEYPDKDLAAVGIAFKLALALATHLGESHNFILRMLDLVALATIADIAPLRGENRVLARLGLKVMNDSPNVGLLALIRAAGLEGKLEEKQITAGRVGYILAPRLNAVGRLGHAMRGVELLLSEREADANGIARELEELNRKRQDIDRATLAEARALAERLDLDSTYGVVLSGNGWHPGVIGIVASRIVEETGRPAVLVAIADGEGKGSGRSIPAFDLHAALSECREMFVRFGGHRAAAGITIRADMVDGFAERFNEIARRRLVADDLVPVLRIDLEIPLDEATEELEVLLRHLEPFGIGNPAPVFVSRDVRLAGPPRVVGREGLKLRLQTSRGEVEAIGWGLADRASELDSHAAVDIAYRLERDCYQGVSRLQVKLADIRR